MDEKHKETLIFLRNELEDLASLFEKTEMRQVELNLAAMTLRVHSKILNRIIERNEQK